MATTRSEYLERAVGRSDDSGYGGRSFERNSDGSIGDPIAGVRITFEAENGSIVKRVTSDEEGRYRLPLPLGRYIVEAAHPEYRDYSSAPGYFVVSGPGFQASNFFLAVRDPRSRIKGRHRSTASRKRQGDAS